MKERVPGTEYVVLSEDTNLTPKAIAAQTIVIETAIEELPEVQALQSGNVVLDIGAFIGDTAVIFLKKRCKVYAFEPQQDAFECLVMNATDARCYNRPVGNGEKVSLSQDTINGNLGTRQVVSDDQEGVPALRIDDIPLIRCDFIKLDAEGSEVLALRGARKTIERFKPIMLIECFDPMLAKRGFSRDDLKKEIESLGYSMRVVIGREIDERLDYLCTPNP